MKPIHWISALGATAILSTGVTAWVSASDLAWAISHPMTAGHDLKGVSAQPDHTHNLGDTLIAGQDLSGVSATPRRAAETGAGDEASKASGPPNKSLPRLV
ncbi:hypothetical protein MKD50_15290 [Cupriavidus sp. WGtm5]|uniref:hypothetical protein n=1 Tax=Cupriavidus TaxID=106589 RepID=UPI000E1042EF|nr:MULTISPECIES: hypothetical protein [Cupriavidus]MCO4890743.1 hypothetical protein [Cupriavidus sp. WGtm5]ULX50910.1 hypothetical protein A9P79_02800 [Cupriavidus taiwanensis]SPA40973.1 conserved exported hypothetical protein [Cupriavidus taiwanensis]SPA41904.1 conserved exported protein of unknown function [Cupriavidus taiwanensis]